MRRNHVVTMGILWVLLLVLVVGCAAEPPAPTATPTPDAAPTITPTPRPAPVSAARTIELTRAGDPDQQAFIRVINAATMTDAVPGIDVYIEGLTIANNLSTAMFTEPLGLVAGEYTLRVMPAGVRLSAGEPIFQTTITPQGRESLIYLLTGTADTLALLPVPEITEPLNRDQSRVSFLNATAASITAQPGNVALAPNQMSSPLLLPSGETTFTFGTLEHPLTLPSRSSYTLVLVGTPENLQVINARVNVPGVLRVRAINGHADGDALDVYLGDTLLAGNLAYGRAGEHLSLPASTQPVAIYPAGTNRDTAEPLAQTDLNPNPNNDDTLSLIIVGDSTDTRIITHLEDLSPTPPETTRVTFVNALNTAPRVTIDTQAGPPAGIGDLSFGAAPQTTSFSATIHTFFWNESDSGDQVEYAPDVQFESGRVYLYLLTGQLGEPPLIFSDSVEQLTTTEGTPVQVRIVNATSSSLNFAVDGTPDTATYNFSDSTPLFPVSPGDHTITIQPNGISYDLPFEAGTVYSLFTYTDPSDTPLFLTVTDQPDTTPAIQLVNLTTSTDSNFSLAIFPLTQPTSDNSRIARSDVERGSIPFGVQSLNNTSAANESASALIPVPAGAHAIYIIDTAGRVAATISQVVFEADHVYTIVADQRPDSPLVEAFVISYTIS